MSAEGFESRLEGRSVVFWRKKQTSRQLMRLLGRCFPLGGLGCCRGRCLRFLGLRLLLDLLGLDLSLLGLGLEPFEEGGDARLGDLGILRTGTSADPDRADDLTVD